MELAQVIARRPPLAARLAKEAVLTAEETGLTAGVEAERRLFGVAMATEDRVEAMQAFLEKRSPTSTAASPARGEARANRDRRRRDDGRRNRPGRGPRRAARP